MKKTGLGVLLAGAAVALVPSSADAALVYGITPDNTLFSFDSASPGTLLSGVPLSNFTANNEVIRGIDFRPATGQLYAIGSYGQLYTVNTTSGALTAVGTGVGPISGTAFGFDFNPVIDRIRLTSNTDISLVLNPNTGALQTTAPNLAYGAADPNFGTNPNIVGSAYTNSGLGAPPATTTLYAIDSGIDVVATQVAATSVLSTVGPLLTVNTGDFVGFDIYTPPVGSEVAFASLTPFGGSVSNFYTINLGTGNATLVGQIDGGTFVNDIAVVPIPEPTGLALLASVAAVGLSARRRRR